MPGKRIDEKVIELVYYNYYRGKSPKDLSEMFNIKLRTVYNIINRAEKENRIHLKHSNGRPKKLSQRDERKIIKKVYENPRTTTRLLSSELREECNVTVSHETVRKVILSHKYSSRVARKKPLLSSQNVQKRLDFAIVHITYTMEYWEDVIFCDETKIMLYYNDGPSRVWRKALEALQDKNIIPTVKFGKLSVMIWGCFSSKGVGTLRFIEDTMNKEQYLDILKKELVGSAQKFGFVDANNPNKLKFKLYQDNDPKHKSLCCRTWALYNTSKVIDTPAQSPDLNPIENLWAHLKKKVAKRHPKTKNQLKQYISEEWSKIPDDYDLKKLTSSMKNRLQAVIDARGSYTKY